MHTHDATLAIVIFRPFLQAAPGLPWRSTTLWQPGDVLNYANVTIPPGATATYDASCERMQSSWYARLFDYHATKVQTSWAAHLVVPSTMPFTSFNVL
jgi:hypothetical protein